MKRFMVAATSLALAGLMSLALSLPSAQAASRKKVDCDQVMSQLNSGKKPKEVAKAMGISASSVYRCRKKAKAAAGAGGNVAAASHGPASKGATNAAAPAAPSAEASPAAH